LWRDGSIPPDALEAFLTLKQKLIQRPILVFPDLNRKFELYTDGSENCVGAMLVQRDDKNIPRAIGYHSKILEPHEKRYSAFLHEQLAIYEGLQKWDRLLKGQNFTVFCDNRPTCHLSKQHTKTLHQLQVYQSEYNFDIQYLKGPDMPADYISRLDGSEVNQIQPQGPFFGSQSIQVHQQHDDFCKSMSQFLQDRNSKTEVPARILQQYAPNCEMKDSTLYYNLKREDRPPSTVPVLPQSLQLQCLLDNHRQSSDR
jgi:hypothetical protein